MGSLAAWLAIGVALLLPGSATALTATGDGNNAVVTSAPGESTGITFVHEKNVTLSSPTPPFMTTLPSAWVLSASVYGPGGTGAPTQAQVSTSPPCTHSNPAPTAPAICPGEGTITFELGDDIDHFGGVAGRAENMLPSHVIANGGSGEDVVFAAALGGTWELDGGPDADVMGLNAVYAQSGGTNIKEALPGSYILKGGEGDDRFLTSNFATIPGTPPFASGSDDAIGIQADGGPGNDHITLIETKGDDHLVGGEGDDDFQDGPGDDVVEGGPGDDQLHGEAGKDTFSGGPGNDEIVSSEVGIEAANKTAGAEADTVECGTGADTVYADGLDKIAADCDELGDVIQSCTEAAGCQVAVTIEAPAEAAASASVAARKHPRRRATVLGRGNFHLAKGKSKLAAARLLKSGQKLIKKKKRLKATIVVRVTSGHGKHQKVQSHRGKVLLVSRRGK